MKKKATTKKFAGKSKKKEIKKRPKTTLKPAGKTVTQKKETKKAKAKEKKTAAKIKTKKKTKKVVKNVVAGSEKKPKKIIKKVVAGIGKKVPIKAAKKVETRKIIEKPGKKVSAKVEVKKEVYPVIEEKYPAMLWEALPPEYGENSIILMTVNPNKLFNFWEVREDILSVFTGNLNIRIYDVTGTDFDGTDANSHFDIPVNKRIGSLYIDVTPEKEFIVDIGIINPRGIFITIARSHKVSTPRILRKGVLPHKLYETDFYVGY